MPRINQPSDWELDTQSPFLPVSYQGKIVGYFQPDYASHVVGLLNEDEKLRKALQLACYDLIARSGGSTAAVNDLVEQYLNKAERPKSGAGVVALLLRERQEELDISDEEFAKFCNSFRLSQEELRNVYNGEEIESSQLVPLARILGITVDELINLWKGNE